MINNVTTNSYASAIRRTTVSPKQFGISNMLTKDQSKLSEEEIENRLMEMARKDVAAGKDSRFTGNGKTLRTDEWHNLSQEYSSFASPDRQGIVTNTLSKLGNVLNSWGINYNQKNIFDYIFKNNHLFKNFKNAEVGSNYVDFKDSNGNTIASYDEFRGWNVIQTPAENARWQEFSVMWDNAMAKAKQEINGNSNVSGRNDGFYIGSA